MSAVEGSSGISRSSFPRHTQEEATPSLMDTTAPPPPPSPPSPSTIIRSLTLPQLLSAPSKYHHKSEQLTTHLNKLNIQTYNSLSTTQTTTHDATQSLSNILLQLPLLTRSLQTISRQLHTIQSKFDNTQIDIGGAHTLKRITTLLKATDVLRRELKEDCESVVGLCTDPERMWKKLLVSCRRYGVVIRLLRYLKEVNREFETKLKELEEVGVDIRDKLKGVVMDGDGDGGKEGHLPLREVVLGLRYLEVQEQELRDMFWVGTRRQLDNVASGRFTSAYIGDSPLGMAANYIQFVIHEKLSLLKTSVVDFKSLFSESEGHVKAMHQIRAVLKEHLEEPVKKLLSERSVFALSSRDDARNYATSIQHLLDLSGSHNVDVAVLHDIRDELEMHIATKLKEETGNMLLKDNEEACAETSSLNIDSGKESEQGQELPGNNTVGFRTDPEGKLSKLRDLIKNLHLEAKASNFMKGMRMPER